MNRIDDIHCDSLRVDPVEQTYSIAEENRRPFEIRPAADLSDMIAVSEQRRAKRAR